MIDRSSLVTCPKLIIEELDIDPVDIKLYTHVYQKNEVGDVNRT